MLASSVASGLPPVTPRIFPGRLHSSNSNSNGNIIDWGLQNLVAYGSHSYVVVLQSPSMRIVQTLDQHKALVTCVKWSPHALDHSLNASKPDADAKRLRLASGDTSGSIFVWDVLSSSIVYSLADDALRSSVVAIEWFRDANQLGALYAPSQFAMWDLNTGQLLYRLSFTEEMVSFALDPFDHTQCCFMSLTGWITMATALGRSEPPVIHPAYRFNATNDTDTSASTPGAGTPGAPGGGGAAAAAQATPSRGGAGALSRSTAGAGQAPSAGAAGAAAGGAKSIVVSKVFHFQYYPCRRGIIFIVLAREIVVYDLTVKLIVATIPLDRGRPTYQSIYFCRDAPQIAYCLHETSCISAWAIESDFKVCKRCAESSQECTNLRLLIAQGQCETRAFWEIGRYSKQNKKTFSSIMGISPGKNLYNHTRIAMLTNDGTVWLWEYVEGIRHQVSLSSSSSAIQQATDDSDASGKAPVRRAKLKVGGMLEVISSTIICMAVFPTGVGSVVSTPKVVRKNTTEFDELGQQVSSSASLVALGTAHGTVQLLDLLLNEVRAEYAVCTQAIRSVHWIGAQQLLAFTCEELTDAKAGFFKNRVYAIDTRDGDAREIRLASTGAEATFIRSIHVSYSQRFFIILLKDKPFELWDVKTLLKLRSVKSNVQVTAIGWCPVLNKKKHFTTIQTEERFVLTAPGGQFHYYSIENNVITKTQIHTDPNVGIVSCVAWKGPHLVTGDTTGTIHCWDFDKHKAKSIATNLGHVRRIRFAPGVGVHHVMVLFKDGDFAVWDLDNGVRVSTSAYLRARDLRGLDIDWISSSQSIVATNDGCVRVLDRALSSASWPLDARQLFLRSPSDFGNATALESPYVIEQRRALVLKALLQHNAQWQLANVDLLSSAPTASLVAGLLLTQAEPVIAGAGSGSSSSSLMPAWLRKSIAASDELGRSTSAPVGAKKRSRIAERCYAVAQYFGDENEIQFWALAIDAFSRAKEYVGASSLQAAQPHAGGSSLSRSGDASSKSPYEESALMIDTNSGSAPSGSLGVDAIAAPAIGGESAVAPAPYVDLLLESSVLRNAETQRAITHDKHRAGYEQTQKNAHLHLLLGRKERAIELLLQTPHTDSRFYQDALKACVIAATHSKSAFENAISHIASHLISQGNLDEGIEFLVAIGKGVDACRYLQSCDRWRDAAWLAKVALAPNETSEILRRWSDDLIDHGKLLEAVPILLTLQCFHEVIQLLHQGHQYHLAFLFFEAANELKLLPSLDDTIAADQPQRLTVTKELLPMQSLYHSIHLDYGQYLFELGLTNAAQALWKRVGHGGNSGAAMAASSASGSGSGSDVQSM